MKRQNQTPNAYPTALNRMTTKLLVNLSTKGLRLPRLTRNMSFLGVMIGLPYLRSLWHPQSKASAQQSKH
jgi:hypothetical protein